jgi:hypothetical protein
MAANVVQAQFTPSKCIVMPHVESVLVQMEFATVSRSLECGNNKAHRLEPGKACLVVRAGRGERRYCIECARAFLTQASDRLESLLAGANRLARI